MYDHSPFLFTSTLRNNLDPFGRYSDEEIREAMQKVGLWNEPTFFDSGLEEEDIQGKLNLKIEDGGINVSLGHKQLINISRALLQKPQVILCDFISSAVAPQKHRAYISRLLLEEFSSSTIFIATHDTSFLPHVDQKINLDNSEIELCRGSDGRPGLPSGGMPTFHAIQGTVSTIKNIPSIAKGMQGT
jgi:ABC-type multidrug transport system fused ATPase/permease subunit